MSTLRAADSTAGATPAATPGRSTGRIVGPAGLALITFGLALFLAGMVAGRSHLVPFMGNTGPFIELDAGVSWTTVSYIARTATVCAGLGTIGLLWALRRGWTGAPLRILLLGGVVAAVFLTILPPAGSIDILNYAIYGRIADLGFDPYSMTPEQLHDAGDPVGLLGPGSWADQPTVYGPVATVVQTVAARLGGASMAWIVFWLKVFNAAAFLGTAALLDRLAGPDRRARVRVAVLWTANPLILFWLVGSGHADVLAVALLIGAVSILWFGLRRAWPSVWLGLGAGVLAGAAISVKVTFALPVLGLGLACIRRPKLLGAGAVGATAAAGLAYLIVGRTAVNSLTERMAHDGDLFLPVPSTLVTRPALYSATMAAATAVAAALLWWRLRDRSLTASTETLDLRPLAACAIACVILSPVQYPWYNAAFLPVLALLGTTRFDEFLMVRAAALSCILLPGIGTTKLQLDSVSIATPICVAIILVLCVAGSKTMPRALLVGLRGRTVK